MAFFLLSVLLLSFCPFETLGSACDSIHFVSRQEWKANPSNLTDMKLPVHHVFIHHTLQEECHTKEECIKTVKTMQIFHNVTRNFGDIGYNFIVGGDGNVYVGRDWGKNGRHTKGMNEHSVAFSLCGDYNKKLPNEKMIKATKQLIQCGLEKKVIAQDYQLHGHRDQVCTECPGDLFYTQEVRKWDRYVAGPLETYTCPYP